MLAFDPIVIELEGAPVGKGRPRFGRGRTYTPAKTRSFEVSLGYAARAVMGARLPLSGPLDVSVTAFFPVPASWSARQRAQALGGTVRPTGKPDWDNLAKTTDALNGIVWRDDALIVDGRIQKFYAAQPLLRIEVRPA